MDLLYDRLCKRSLVYVKRHYTQHLGHKIQDKGLYIFYLYMPNLLDIHY